MVEEGGLRYGCCGVAGGVVGCGVWGGCAGVVVGPRGGLCGYWCAGLLWVEGVVEVWVLLRCGCVVIGVRGLRCG